MNRAEQMRPEMFKGRLPMCRVCLMTSSRRFWPTSLTHDYHCRSRSRSTVTTTVLANITRLKTGGEESSSKARWWAYEMAFFGNRLTILARK